MAEEKKYIVYTVGWSRRQKTSMQARDLNHRFWLGAFAKSWMEENKRSGRAGAEGTHCREGVWKRAYGRTVRGRASGHPEE